MGNFGYGKDLNGNDVASGIYFVKLKAASNIDNEFVQVRKMILLR